MKITNCYTNHILHPLGYHMPKPVFTWCVEDSRGKRAAESRVIVSAAEDLSELLWDSGFDSSLSGLGCTPDLSLQPRTRYYWTVTVRSDAGEEATGPVQWFETGKMEEPWAGRWITCLSCPDQESGEVRHPVFEKELKPAKKLKSARLYICGLGLYEAEINGRKIGEEYLAPGCNNYNGWLQYQTYDITEDVRDGGVLAVTLGNGWYKGRFGFEKSTKGFFGDTFQLIAEVRFTYEDGTESAVGTDESWTVRQSRILFSNIYDGEKWDAALPETEAVPVMLCSEETCPKAPLTERYSPPVIAHMTRKPVLIHTPAGENVFDLGQNVAGSFLYRVQIPEGATLRLQFGEQLQDGCFYRENLRTAKAEFVYVSDGTCVTLRPRFTFFGGRYVKVDGIENPDPADFTALCYTSQMERTGYLETGNDLVNRLISNIEWSRLDNFIDVPTDCPQRDERMGWTGDAQVFAPTACFLADAYAFYRKYLHDIETEQRERNGQVPNVVPSCGIQGTSSVWGDAATIIPWILYQFTGDPTILEEQFASMKSWVDYISGVDGDDCGWRDVFHFGDWLALDRGDTGAGDCKGATDEGFIADIYYRYSTQILSQAAKVLGYSEEASQYEELAETLEKRIKEEYFTPSGRCAVPTQTGLLLTLCHGLADPARTAADLRKKLASNHNHLDTGFVGTPLLCNMLSEHGMSDLSEVLLLNEEYPGWLREVKMGATTIWERWNSLDENGHFSSTGMNSLNHYAYGSVAEWMFRHLAGLQPLQPGFVKARVAPTPIWELKTLDSSYRSAAGLWKVHWHIIDAEHLHVEATVPFGCIALLKLPFSGEEEQVLEAGHYTYTYRTTKPLHQVMTSRNTVAELLADPKAKAILERMIPQIVQLPERMRNTTMRDVAVRMGGSQAEAMLEELDAMLKRG